MKRTLIVPALLVATLIGAASPAAQAGKVHVNIGVGFYNPTFGASVGYGSHHHHNSAPVVVAPAYPVYQPYATPVVFAPHCAPPVYRPAPIVYVPAYSFIYEKQWVPAVWQTQLIGYDHCGKPVTQQVCVSQGYYRTLRYRLYSNGAKVFDGYV